MSLKRWLTAAVIGAACLQASNGGATCESVGLDAEETASCPAAPSPLSADAAATTTTTSNSSSDHAARRHSVMAVSLGLAAGAVVGAIAVAASVVIAQRRRRRQQRDEALAAVALEGLDAAWIRAAHGQTDVVVSDVTRI